MKLLLINSVCGTGSTGRICVDLAREYEQNGYEVKIAYGRNEGTITADARKYAVRVGSDLDVYAHVLYTRITDKHGLASKRVTRRFLEWANEFDPDILWLHNIHGYYINYEMLFAWIRKRPQMQVKWTLHDCWAFTGHCAFYTYSGCDRWKHPEGCRNCPNKKSYPASYLNDNSTDNLHRKKQTFTGLHNLTLITPSKWLADEVKSSILSEYETEVRYNDIDTSVFKPTPSDFRSEHGLSDTDKMLLGVANVWEKRKGLDDFIRLAEMLPDSYKIFLVGLSDKQIKQLQDQGVRITAVRRTDSAEELAAIYSAADVFLNPTYEDNFPSVILEAEACGTLVITYDTGGCSEAVHLPASRVIPQGVDNLASAVKDMLI